MAFMKLHYMTEGKGIVTLALKDRQCKEKKKRTVLAPPRPPLSAKVMEQDNFVTISRVFVLFVLFCKHGNIGVFLALVIASLDTKLQCSGFISS